MPSSANLGHLPDRWQDLVQGCSSLAIEMADRRLLTDTRARATSHTLTGGFCFTWERTESET
ncbi:MAG: hypothetical protein JWQ18_1313 [Conexibacter sp.]|nr:hypothetical protein [Conexibacter sp.]